MNRKEELIYKVVNHLLEADSSLHNGMTYQVIKSLKYSKRKLINILNYDDITTNKFIEYCKKYFDNEIGI